MHSLLTVSAERAFISPKGSAPVIMLVGPAQIVEKAFRQSRPNAVQLESAINIVEDSIMATKLRAIPRGVLVAEAQIMHQALGVVSAPSHLSLAQVEQRYQDISMLAQRLPYSPVLDLAPLALATLILVRECMHHLGYAELVLV